MPAFTGFFQRVRQVELVHRALARSDTQPSQRDGLMLQVLKSTLSS